MCKAEQHASLSMRQEHECDNGLLFGLFEKIHTAVADIAASSSLRPERPDDEPQQQHRGHHHLSASHSSSDDVSDASSTSSSHGSASRKRTAKESSPEPPSSQRQVKKQRRGRGPASTTERGFQRIAIEHSYHDNSQATEEPDETTAAPEDDPLSHRCNGGIATTFPVLLHQLLEDAQGAGFSDVVNWLPHGRAFLVFDQQRFVTEVMPRYFRQTRFRSFQRQLSLYGFLRLTRKGSECGAYYHELCLRGMPFLCKRIQRHRVKGWMVRQASSPETEPNFWDMPAVGIPDPTPLAQPVAAAAVAASVQSCGHPVETPLKVGSRQDPVSSNRAAPDILSPRPSLCLSDFCLPIPTWDTPRQFYPPVPVPSTFRIPSHLVASTTEKMVQGILNDEGMVWPAAPRAAASPPAGKFGASNDLTLEEQADLVSFLLDVDLDTEDDR